MGHVTVTSASYRPSVAGVRGVARGIARRATTVVGEALRLPVGLGLADLDRRGLLGPHGLRGLRRRRRSANRVLRVVEHLGAAVADDFHRTNRAGLHVRSPAVGDEAVADEDDQRQRGDEELRPLRTVVVAVVPPFRVVVHVDAGVAVPPERDVLANVGGAQHELDRGDDDEQVEVDRVEPLRLPQDHDDRDVDRHAHRDADAREEDLTVPVVLVGLLLGRRVLAVALCPHLLQLTPGDADQLLGERHDRAVPEHEDDDEHEVEVPHALLQGDGPARREREGHELHGARPEQQEARGGDLDQGSDALLERATHHEHRRDGDEHDERCPGDVVHGTGDEDRHHHDEEAPERRRTDQKHDEARRADGHVRAFLQDLLGSVGEVRAGAAEGVEDVLSESGCVGHGASGDGKVVEAVGDRSVGFGELSRDRLAETFAVLVGRAVLHLREHAELPGDFRHRLERLGCDHHEAVVGELHQPRRGEHQNGAIFIEEVVAEPSGHRACKGVAVLVVRDDDRRELWAAAFFVLWAADDATDGFFEDVETGLGGHD